MIGLLPDGPVVADHSTIDPSESLPTRRPRLLKPGDLQLTSDEDAIPALFAEDGLFVEISEGDREWADEELVIGIAIGDDARAYPIRLLSNHEIVNDTVGGEPLAITWCPLCFSAIVFDRVVDGKDLTFGVSGYLYNDNLVMYDHRTNTLWSQLLGEAIRGALKGQRLLVKPATMTSWAQWKDQHPSTRVLSAERLGLRAGEVVDPYVAYYNSGIAGLTGINGADAELQPKELVIGLSIGAETRGYPLSTLADQVLVNDRLAGIPVMLIYSDDLGNVQTYQRDIEGRELTFSLIDEQLLDTETGSIWDIQTGEAVGGPMSGERLPRIAAPLVYWFAWSGFHPDTDIFSP